MMRQMLVRQLMMLIMILLGEMMMFMLMMMLLMMMRERRRSIMMTMMTMMVPTTMRMHPAAVVILYVTRTRNNKNHGFYDAFAQTQNAHFKHQPKNQLIKAVRTTGCCDKSDKKDRKIQSAKNMSHSRVPHKNRRCLARNNPQMNDTPFAAEIAPHSL